MRSLALLALGPRSLLRAEGCPCVPASPSPAGTEPGWLPPALLRKGSWGEGGSAPCCRCVTSPSLRLKTRLGKHVSFWLGTEGEGKLFVPSSNSDVPLETLAQGGGHPWDLGEHGGGAGQVRALGKAVRGRQGLVFVPFSLNLWELMSLPAAIITDYMPFACCIKAACLINIILRAVLA